MKLFKRIYYPIIAILAVLMIIFSFVDFSAAGNTIDADKAAGHVRAIASEPHSANDTTALYYVSTYILNELENMGAERATPELDDETKIVSASYSVLRKPTVVAMETVISSETFKAIGSTDIYVAKNVKNIVLMIKGTAANNKAVLFTAGYNSAVKSNGVSDNASSVAAMLEAIREVIDSGKSYENDLVFVFTDGSKDGNMGIQAFLHQFEGFDYVAKKITVAFNFDTLGHNGTTAIVGGINNSDIMYTIARTSNGYVSSLFPMLFKNENSDFKAMKKYASINFANIGGSDQLGGEFDTFENLSKSMIAEKGEIILGLVDNFGNADIKDVINDDNIIYFGYLGLFTIVYNWIIAFVFLGIIVGLIAAIIAINSKTKVFSLTKALLGCVIMTASLIATAVFTYAMYYLVGIFAVAINILTLEALTHLIYSNFALIILGCIISGSFATFCMVFLKKLLKVKAADVVRGTVLLLSLISIITIIFIPAVSFIPTILTLLELIVILISVIFKNGFRNTFKMDMDRLFLPLLPLIICIPIVLSAVIGLTTVLGLMFFPLIVSIFILTLGLIAPYFSYLSPFFKAISDKLPERTVRIKKTVIEKVENAAKKGKFEDKEVEKIELIKQKRKFGEGHALSVVITLALIVSIVFSSFNTGITQRISSTGEEIGGIYDNAMIYKVVNDGTTSKGYWVIKDINILQYIDKAVSGYEWSNEENAYIREDIQEVNKFDLTSVFNALSDFYLISPLNNASNVTIILKDLYGTGTVTFRSPTNIDYVYNIVNANGEYKFVLPYNFGVARMKFTGNLSANNVQYIEERSRIEAVSALNDWNAVQNYYYGQDILNQLSGGLIIEFNTTINN